jgi:hypothetical protein
MKTAFYKRAERLKGAWVVYYEEASQLKDVRLFSCPFEAKRSADDWEGRGCPKSPPRYSIMILVFSILFILGVVLYEFSY